MNSRNMQLAVILMAIAPINTQAYLDPGSGSLIIQAVVGAIAGAFMFCKLYWTKIKDFFSKKNEK